MDNTLLDALRTRKSYAKGAIGEFIACQKLRESGYDVSTSTEAKSGDLIVHLAQSEIKVEVKTATRGKDGYYHFQLYKQDKHGSSNHLNSDIVLFIVASKVTTFFYLVPSRVLRYRSHASIKDPINSKGFLAKFRLKTSNIQLESLVN